MDRVARLSFGRALLCCNSAEEPVTNVQSSRSTAEPLVATRGFRSEITPARWCFLAERVAARLLDDELARGAHQLEFDVDREPRIFLLWVEPRAKVQMERGEVAREKSELGLRHDGRARSERRVAVVHRVGRAVRIERDFVAV